MKMLALETSGFSGSLALLQDGKPTGTAVLDPDQRTAQFLAPTIQSLLAQYGWQLSDLGVIAVTSGPGSFTGLRIGITTAKVLAYVIDAQIVAVNTLETCAWQVPFSYRRLDVILDAHRQELFVASYQRLAADSVDCTTTTRILPVEGWLKSLQPNVHVTGPAVAKLIARLPNDVTVVEPRFRDPTAVAVGHLASRLYNRGQTSDLWTLVPQYHRESAAEEKQRKSRL